MIHSIAGERKRILLVDDELAYADMMKLTLEMTGQYRVWTLACSSQAATVARNFKPDLILLDCMMPGMDGGEAAGAIEADPELSGTPVAFLTATVSEPETAASQCYRGTRTFLPKSIALKELVDFIEEKTMDCPVPPSGC